MFKILFIISIVLFNANANGIVSLNHKITKGAPDDSPGHTFLTFAFDDTFKSGLEMAKILRTTNNTWNSTFYISPARLGCLHKDYLNWWDIHNLHETGHEIGCHGYSHEKSFDLDETALFNQFGMCRAALRRFGPPTSIAYPHGQVNETVKAVAKEVGFSNGRGVGGILEIIQPRDIWNFKSYSVRREDTCDVLYFKLEDAILSGPTVSRGITKWLVLNFHVMCEKEGDACNKRYPYSILRSTFECLMGHVKELEEGGYLSIKSVREALQQTGPVPQIPRSFDGIDLPSDFVFKPELDPTTPDSTPTSSSASALSVGASLLSLISVFYVVM